jgi:acyl-coenzyme A thioesterase PaaI-like protein
VSGGAPGGFSFTPLPTAEVRRQEGYLVPLADAVRDLVDATIRSTVPEAEVREVTALVEAATERLRARQLDGAAGVHLNGEGYSWQWGNAAVGLRNAAAPPMRIEADGAGVHRADVTLGAAHEGPPGKVHGGVLALLLDHLMGVAASSGRRPTLTGTLTIRYRSATGLGPLRAEAWIDREEGLKTVVLARVAAAGATTVEAEGVFVVPRWAREYAARERANGTGG